MKTKKILFAAILTAFSVSFQSCDDKNDTPDPLTTEESKDLVDESLTEVASAFEGMASLRSATVAESMNSLEIDAPDFNDLIKSATEVTGTSLDSLQQAIEDGIVTLSLGELTNWGTYTYNFDNEEFVFVEGKKGLLQLLLPSSNDMTSNDVAIVLDVDFKTVNIDETLTIDGDEEFNYQTYEYESNEKEIRVKLLEVFTDIDFSIKQDDDLLIGYTMSMSMDDEDMPNKMETSLTVENFKVVFSFDASKRSDKISQSAKFLKDGKELIGYDVTLDGNLNDERIEEIVDEINTLDETEAEPSDEFLATLDYDIIAEFRFGDFKIKGLVDGSKIYDSYESYNNLDDTEKSDQKEAEYMAEKINEAMYLKLLKKNGAAVGQLEAYVAEDTYDNDDYEEYDYEEYDYEEYDYSYYNIEVRFKFTDGTYISPQDENEDSELNTIFKDFLDEIKKIKGEVNEMAEKFD